MGEAQTCGNAGINNRQCIFCCLFRVGKRRFVVVSTQDIAYSCITIYVLVYYVFVQLEAYFSTPHIIAACIETYA